MSDRPPVYNFPAEALSGLVSRQERVTRVHQLPERRLGRLDVFPSDYYEIFPDGPPTKYQQNIPISPPPMYAGAIGERNQRDLSSAALYGPIIWPTMPFCGEDPPNWKNCRPE